MKPKTAASIFCARLRSVVQIFNLLYCRFSICGAGELQKRLGILDAQPNANRRYGRLKICATFGALAFLASSCSTMTPPAPVKGASPGAATLSDFKLTGDLGREVAAFTLTATATVEDARRGSLELLSG